MAPKLFELRVLYGELRLNSLKLPFDGDVSVESLTLARQEVDRHFVEDEIVFVTQICIQQGKSLQVRLG
jgi:hypothetical protein